MQETLFSYLSGNDSGGGRVTGVGKCDKITEGRHPISACERKPTPYFVDKKRMSHQQKV